MGSDGAHTETDGSNRFDVVPINMTSTPLILSEGDENSSCSGDAAIPDDLAVDGNKSAAQGVVKFADEVEILKKKIFDLQQQVQIASSTNTAQGTTSVSQIADEEEHKRMEESLYKHRKEWEREQESRTWRVSSRSLNSDRRSFHSWRYDTNPEYLRPNPFDPSYNFADNKDDASITAYEDYDRTINYGYRRERLRKNFEWDLDRLWLAEEFDKRRLESKETQEGPPKRTNESQGQNEGSGKNGAKQNASLIPTLSEPKLNRVNWSEFLQLNRLQEEKAFALDVLIGESTIDDDLGEYRRWYGYSGRRYRKIEKIRDRKAYNTDRIEQVTLPERIRIHSRILRYILATILGSQARLLKKVPLSVVLVRPFKAIFYCKEALQDWSTALDKKLNTALKTGNSTRATSEELTGNNTTVENPSIEEATVAKPVKQAEESSKDSGNDNHQIEEDSDDDDDDSDEEIYSTDSTDSRDSGAKGRKREEKKKLQHLAKSPVALEHLKCLLDFVNSEILRRVDYLNGPQCRKVFFSDLWLLFRPGMEVIGSDGKQAYRVIGVTSAKHRVATAWERWNNNAADDKPESSPFDIACIYIDFDGKNLGPVTKKIDFRIFDGEKDITLLEVYPLRFHPVKQSDFGDSMWREVEALPTSQKYRRKLIQRGAMFLDVSTVKHMHYAGPTLEVRDDVESQVIIDFETAFSVGDEMQKQWKPVLQTLIGNPSTEEVDEKSSDGQCRGGCCLADIVYDDSYIDKKQNAEYINSLLPKATSSNEQPSVAICPRPLKEVWADSAKIRSVSDEELVIMSYRVFGFILRSRKWAKLDLSYLTAVHAPETSVGLAESEHSRDPGERERPSTIFNRLVLEKDHRPMIISLVAQHFRDKELSNKQQQQVGIVKGKGKGLILLLHGAPGVGKTSTAEGVAELFKKPLFQITCGDLGTTAPEVEKALETNFALANRWDCILLLGEADVFLAERTKEDFNRNALVAVFLRVMEYYAGILFLTTDRVGNFDEAFTSRIHISLYYPELNVDKTVKAFNINLDMIEDRFLKTNRKIKIDKTKIGAFAASHFAQHQHARWNGRQIRNTCQTALALAEYEAQGNSHETILKPDAVVHLNETHFETRAQEGRLRAVWTDENNSAIYINTKGRSGLNKKKDFFDATQGQPPQQVYVQRLTPQPQQYNLQQSQGPQYAQSFQPQQDLQQQQMHQQMGVQQPYYQHSNINAPQPVYPDPRQMQMPNIPGSLEGQGNMQAPRSIPQQQAASSNATASRTAAAAAQQFGQAVQGGYTTAPMQ